MPDEQRLAPRRGARRDRSTAVLRPPLQGGGGKVCGRPGVALRLPLATFPAPLRGGVGDAVPQKGFGERRPVMAQDSRPLRLLLALSISLTANLGATGTTQAATPRPAFPFAAEACFRQHLTVRVSGMSLAELLPALS